jgi:hypothetical protein
MTTLIFKINIDGRFAMAEQVVARTEDGGEEYEEIVERFGKEYATKRVSIGTASYVSKTIREKIQAITDEVESGGL